MRGPGCAALRLLLLLLAQVGAQAPARAVGSAAASPGTWSAGRRPGRAEPPGWVEAGEYDLVSPYEVDRDGNYVSPAVTHGRRRREAARRGGSSLHLRLTGFRRDFHLELEAARQLVAPGFAVHTLGKGGARSVRPLPPEDFCFYQGSLRAHENSSVALSTCEGLSGMIRTQEADYFLKPLPSHLAEGLGDSAGGGRPSHILYKRSAEPRAQAGRLAVAVQRQRELEKSHVLAHESRHLHGGWKPGRPHKQHFCGRRKKYMPKPPAEDLFVLPDEYPPGPRSKRAVPTSRRNEELNVETLVVVDTQMLLKHGRDNVTTYVLTILNMVSALFKDGTIGGNINIAIVGLILLEEEQPGLVLRHHADRTLSSFCQWQSGLTGKDGTRHDHAILLTGLDICSWKNEPCDTLGFAPISGMCSKYRSCTINEDTGLGLAFTIAHESGHNFGMVHDGEGNLCTKSEGSIMSPTLAGRNGLFSWSACSRQYLRRFLSTAQATCLADQPKPVKEYKYPEQLPGQLYDADTQCKWQFGERARRCTLDLKKDICTALWCHRIGRKCETKFMPAAEGTACGHDMWCRGGQCVRYGDEGPKPTHGHWSDWAPWSPCSRTCGGGVSHRDRLCANPRPSRGGRFCEGPSRTLQLCNQQKCPHDSADFRATQCAEFNGKRFRGRLYRWRPYTQVGDQDLCKLYCIAEGFDFFFSLSNKVKDGTPCAKHSRNVCVDGMCERVGCDLVLGSDATEDSCGVCKGNNSECTTHRGLYAKQHRTNQYRPVVAIPPGARGIRVRETSVSACYIAVRSARRAYYLNGRWAVDRPGRYAFSGAAFDYRRPRRQPESLSSAGPTNETLVVELLFQGRNPGVAWEYSVPRPGADRKPGARPSYAWAVVRSACSVSCGGGQMTTGGVCYRERRVQVNASFCDPSTRPATGVAPCQVAACPPSALLRVTGEHRKGSSDAPRSTCLGGTRRWPRGSAGTCRRPAWSGSAPAPCPPAPAGPRLPPQAPHGAAGSPRPGLSARPAAGAACRPGPCSAWRAAGRPRAAPCTRGPQPPWPATLTTAPSRRREGHCRWVVDDAARVCEGRTHAWRPPHCAPADVCPPPFPRPGCARNTDTRTRASGSVKDTPGFPAPRSRGQSSFLNFR
ncbi:A disintegrin and metalloproteinase with thrombospondin motifs 16 isoform X6 [Rousettus aegyptiacus]|uniref:A disintegrin and metalloproteinase with thrombospondin motifs 16 isoform X6 n=1 Tax=Rousettus aegyptiacus TaxID=9407 RepID=UPI00168CB335|nr:A disintegrin and metalloproteinase with thrombospondin motifs 16 isoform X6 [Rousettus aegyptiacus]